MRDGVQNVAFLGWYIFSCLVAKDFHEKRRSSLFLSNRKISIWFKQEAKWEFMTRNAAGMYGCLAIL